MPHAKFALAEAASLWGKTLPWMMGGRESFHSVPFSFRYRHTRLLVELSRVEVGWSYSGYALGIFTAGSWLAEGEGFEPSMDRRPILVFETSAFNHSATPPTAALPTCYN